MKLLLIESSRNAKYFKTSVQVVKNPLSGKCEQRVLVTSQEGGLQTILLKEEEMDACVPQQVQRAGIRKLYKAIQPIYLLETTEKQKCN